MDPDLLARKRAQLEKLMSTSADISENAVPKVRYCICSTPRSGSTMLAALLSYQGIGGRPDEYLNPIHMQAWARLNPSLGQVSVNEYLLDMERRRTSPSGYFGIKIHWRHLKMIAGSARLDEVTRAILSRYDRFILLRRRDKNSQAVSDYIARETGLFHPDQENWISRYTVGYDYRKIADTLNTLREEEDSWIAYLTGSSVDYFEIEFEELVRNYQGVTAELFRFLGLAATPPPMPQTRMRDHQKAEFKSRFISDQTL